MKWAFAGAAVAVALAFAPPAPAQCGGGFCFPDYRAPVFGVRYGVRYGVRFGPAFNYGHGWGGFYGFNAPVVIQQPIVVVPPAVDPFAGLDPDDFIIVRPRAPAPAAGLGGGAIGNGGAPAAGGVARFNPPAAKPAAAQAKQKQPAPKKPRGVDLGVKPADLPKEDAAPNARAETARQVRLGTEAFEAGQYGRAADRFARAAAVAGDDVTPLFLLAQAHFATAKYREAVAATAEGMTARGDWPSLRLQARDVYGNNRALFDRHLAALKQASAAAPDDAGLLFLLGHQLWFDGRRAEARTILGQAAERTDDPTLIDRFLAVK